MIWTELRRVLENSLPHKEKIPEKYGFIFDESKKDEIIVIEFRAGDLQSAISDWEKIYHSLIASLGGTRSAMKRQEERMPERFKRAERIFKALEAIWRGKP